MRVLHLASADDWEAALRTGRYTGSTRGRTLEEEGFVHAATRTQLAGVVERFYSDVGTPLVLLVLDVDSLESAGSTVRWEGVADAGSPFPHVYGPLPLDAVVATLEVLVADGGLPVDVTEFLDRHGVP